MFVVVVSKHTKSTEHSHIHETHSRRHSYWENKPFDLLPITLNWSLGNNLTFQGQRSYVLCQSHQNKSHLKSWDNHHPSTEFSKARVSLFYWREEVAKGWHLWPQQIIRETEGEREKEKEVCLQRTQDHLQASTWNLQMRIKIRIKAHNGSAGCKKKAL